jgi:hypothetical protein
MLSKSFNPLLIHYFTFVAVTGCPHSELLGVTGLNLTENRLLLLGFLTSELQACRILGQDDEAMEVDQEEVSNLELCSSCHAEVLFGSICTTNCLQY